MNSLQKQRALITGASAGIGLELANCFARGGFDLVLVARREEKLNEIKFTLEKRFGVSVQVLAADLSAPDVTNHIVQVLADTPIDILVNNAGFGDYGFFAESDAEKMSQVLAVNIVALTQLTRAFLPQMIGRGSGRILNVGSTAGFLPGPLMAIYYASKAYVLSFSEALGNELQNSGVSVTCLCPGATRSEFQQVANMQSSKLSVAAMMSSHAVARAGYEGCLRGDSIVIPGRVNQFFANVPRFLPRSWITRIVRNVQERK